MAVVPYDVFKQQVPNYVGALKALKKSDAEKFFQHNIALQNPCNNEETPEGKVVSGYQRQIDQFITTLCKKIYGEQQTNGAYVNCNSLKEWWLDTGTFSLRTLKSESVVTQEKINALYESLEKFDVKEIYQDMGKIKSAHMIKDDGYGRRTNDNFALKYKNMVKEYCAYEADMISKEMEDFFSGTGSNDNIPNSNDLIS